eukprot:11431106-Alexandrium_andersonii.AAC.1
MARTASECLATRGNRGQAGVQDVVQREQDQQRQDRAATSSLRASRRMAWLKGRRRVVFFHGHVWPGPASAERLTANMQQRCNHVAAVSS